MIIDRTHIGWGIATAAASTVVGVIYVAHNYPASLPVHIPLPGWMGPSPPLRDDNIGATPLGLIYGIIAMLIFMFAAVLGWRRNHPTWVGRMQLWLKGHIWLTLFTIPLVLMHCGFNGGGPMTQILMWLYTLVMVSGIFGLILQQVLPRMMRRYLPEEVIFDQIPYIRERLIARAGVLRKSIAAPVVVVSEDHGMSHGNVSTERVTQVQPVYLASTLSFLDTEGLPFLKKVSPSRKFRLRDQQVSDNLFRLLKLQVPENIRDSVEQFQSLVDEKRRLDLQVRMQHWLHTWLICHAPASFLLIVMTAWHALVALFTYA